MEQPWLSVLLYIFGVASGLLLAWVNHRLAIRRDRQAKKPEYLQKQRVLRLRLRDVEAKLAATEEEYQQAEELIRWDAYTQKVPDDVYATAIADLNRPIRNLSEESDALRQQLDAVEQQLGTPRKSKKG